MIWLNQKQNCLSNLSSSTFTGQFQSLSARSMFSYWRFAALTQVAPALRIHLIILHPTFQAMHLSIVFSLIRNCLALRLLCQRENHLKVDFDYVSLIQPLLQICSSIRKTNSDCLWFRLEVLVLWSAHLFLPCCLWAKSTKVCAWTFQIFS